MNSPVEQIKERLGVEELVSSYIKLARAGASLKAKCPFHNEKTPSFFVSPDRGTYYCFGCGAKGDIFSFVQEFEGLDFRGALKLLAERTGVKIGKYDKKKDNQKERLYSAMKKSSQFFTSKLKENKEAMNYLKERGLEEKTIQDFRLGFALDSWDSLRNFMNKEGFKDEDLEKAGLIKRGDKGFYDRFRSRIMFPITDTSGRVIAFSGRIFGNDKKSSGVSRQVTAKYINSPETPLFNKSLVLYGLDRAKTAIRKNNFSVLVEGQFDLILSHQAGFKNTIATSGTALSENTSDKEQAFSNLSLVRRLSPNIVLAFDSDDAGVKAIERAGRLALYLGMDVKVADIPHNLDPADLISKEGLDAWRKAIRDSKHVINFLLDKVLVENQNDPRKVGRRIREQILPYVDVLPSSIEKSHFLKKISEESSIPEYALEEDLKKLVKSGQSDKSELTNIENATKDLLRLDHIERRIFGILFWQESLGDQSADLGYVKEKLKEILESSFQEIWDRNKKQEEDLIFEAEVFYSGNADFKKDITELLSNMKEEYLRKSLSDKMQKLKEAEESGDFKKSEDILKQCQIISQKIEDIKRGRLTR